MATFFATMTIFGLVVAAMAVGVAFHGRRLRGSCGGVGQDCSCSVTTARSCPTRQKQASGIGLNPPFRRRPCRLESSAEAEFQHPRDQRPHAHGFR